MDNRLRTHPMVVIAAIAVILTCLIAVGVVTGVVPSPLAKERRAADLTTESSHPAVSQSQNAYAPSAAPRSASDGSAPTTRNAQTTRSAETKRSATGTTPGTGRSQSVTASSPAARACDDCGSVTSVTAVRKQGEASMIGPAAGGLVGGVVGHQIGSGRGNTIATIAGAAVGAGAGTEIERRYKSTTHYVVEVRMNDGRVRHFNYASAPGFQTGDKVRVVDGRLSRS